LNLFEENREAIAYMLLCCEIVIGFEFIVYLTSLIS